jgi:hypothetical protein
MLNEDLMNARPRVSYTEARRCGRPCRSLGTQRGRREGAVDRRAFFARQTAEQKRASAPLKEASQIAQRRSSSGKLLIFASGSDAMRDHSLLDARTLGKHLLV